ncbi:MAG: DUF1549 domain-containing protein, partial [Verrucomicrobiota bacterium]
MMNPRIFLRMVALAAVSLSHGWAVDFEKDIRPILEFRCVECHRDGVLEGELRMDSLQALLEGGYSGPALVQKDPDKSLMLERILLPGDDPDIMPPKGKPLTSEEAGKIRKWIEAGAPWSGSEQLIAREEEDYADPLPLVKSSKKVRDIAVYPPAVSLDSGKDFQGVVVSLTYDDDSTADVTESATFTLQDKTLAERRGNRFYPLKDGKSNLVVQVAGKQKSVPFEVKKAAEIAELSFKLDVMPVFMRENCNTGECHGSARGQDGFMLSLFGYDPDGDYHRLTREMNGRRVNLAIPEESLLVEKSVEAVPHTGGKLFKSGSDSWLTMVNWLREGAKKDPDEIPKVVDVEVLPKQMLLEGDGSEHRLTVRATYSDGTDRDVTNLSVFITNNEPTAQVDRDGLITAGKRGEAFVMARYDTFTVGSQVIVIPEGLEYEKPKVEPLNYIDELVQGKLHKLRIIPSELCSDDDFLRRAYLDIIGQLPSRAELAAFKEDKSSKKRADAIDGLLSRKEFTEIWVMKWAELLQIRSDNNVNQGLSYKAALLYFNWLQDGIAKNTPLDELVRELLSATGGTFANPQTNYYNTERDLLKVSENAAQVFMGFRLQCAQCHNHPFDRWTMDDYYGWAAFFSQIGRKRTSDPREEIIFNKKSGETKHPVGNRTVAPRFLGGEVADVNGKDRRAVMADWLTSPENPYFSTNVANLIWEHFFGVGIV